MRLKDYSGRSADTCIEWLRRNNFCVSLPVIQEPYVTNKLWTRLIVNWNGQSSFNSFIYNIFLKWFDNIPCLIREAFYKSFLGEDDRLLVGMVGNWVLNITEYFRTSLRRCWMYVHFSLCYCGYLKHCLSNKIIELETSWSLLLYFWFLEVFQLNVSVLPTSH